MSKECCMCFKKIEGKPWMSVLTLEEKPSAISSDRQEIAVNNLSESQTSSWSE